MESAYGEIISRLSTAAEFKDTDTGLHILRISKYTQTLARLAGLPEKMQTLYAQASPMHDIGKIGIPDKILLKPGSLDLSELTVMQSHTILGAQILSGSHSPLLKLARLIALHHHERWDGSGYPQRLTGPAIPLAARIVSIVDQYDALRSQRPYKNSIDHAGVVKIISKGDGRTSPEHFDPEILNHFVVNNQIFEEIFESLKE